MVWPIWFNPILANPFLSVLCCVVVGVGVDCCWCWVWFLVLVCVLLCVGFCCCCGCGSCLVVWLLVWTTCDEKQLSVIVIMRIIIILIVILIFMIITKIEGGRGGEKPSPRTALPQDRDSPGPPSVGPPSAGPPKSSLFFFPLPPQNSFFSSLSGGLLVEFWWCF